MDSKSQKTFLEVYGIGRIILGVGELVGLFASFFLLEWIVSYPVNAPTLLLDKDAVALMYLAVLLRGIFHTLAGVGIARMKPWGAWVLAWGWPIMLMITYSFVYALFEQWNIDGLANGNVFAVIAWPKFILYIAWVIFDYAFINKMIYSINTQLGSSQENMRVSNSKVFSIVGIAVVAFALLFFMGGAIKEGFHKGFYKTSGYKESKKGTKATVVEETAYPSQDEMEPPVEVTPPKEVIIPLEQSLPFEKEEHIDAVFTSKKATVEESIPTEDKMLDKSLKEGELQQGIAYARMIGIVALLFMTIGLTFQIFEIIAHKNTANISLICFAMQVIAFGLFLVSALMFKETVIAILSLGVCLLSSFIVYLKIKNETM